jgi:hypothetical protein
MKHRRVGGSSPTRFILEGSLRFELLQRHPVRFFSNASDVFVTRYPARR